MKNIWLIAVSFASFFLAVGAQAQGLGGLTYESFDSTIVLNKDASFDVTETIRGEFLEPRHGIYRAIPFKYTGENGLPFTTRLTLKSVRLNGDSVPYDWYRDGSFQFLKIGDADVTRTGAFEYELAYKVERAILFHPTNDELYWNVMGDAWDAPVQKITASVGMKGFRSDQMVVECYTGEKGSKSTCTSGVGVEGVTFTAPSPFTVSVSIPKNTITEPGSLQHFMWWLADNWDLFSILIPLITLAILFHRWWHHGRDSGGRKVIVAEYAPPDGLNALEVGTLTDAQMHPRDFAAGIVELAAMGYLTIKEEKGGWLSSTEYILTRVKPTDDTLKPIEKQLLDGLFGGETEMKMSDRKEEIAKLRSDIGSTAYTSMASDGYYLRNPNISRVIYFGIGVAIAVFGVFIGGSTYDLTLRPVVMISFLVTAGFFFLFAPFMPKKSEKGAVSNDIAKGFKLFMETAEKHRSEWQEKEGIFEKYLPYAVAFGIVGKWATAFKAVHPNAAMPAWYFFPHGSVGDIGSIGDHIGSFADFAGTVKAPSSSGGVGGGGFSGGGFGGGGGGSW